MTLSSTRIRFSSCTIRRVGGGEDFAESEKIELNPQKW